MRVSHLVPGFRIGTKLGICVGIGVALVAALIVNEQMTSNSIERLTAAADRQQAIVIDSISTEVVLQRALVLGRNLRMARTSLEVDKLAGELQQIAAAGRERLSALEAQSVDPANRDRFKSIKDLFAQYVSALSDCGTKQIEILSLFEKLDQVGNGCAASISS
jgi:hypothetical protein